MIVRVWGIGKLRRGGVYAHSRPPGVLGRVRPQNAGAAGNRDLGGE